MKKYFAVFLALLIAITCTSQVFAADYSDTTNDVTVQNEEVLYYEDGSYDIITVTKAVSRATITGTKTQNHYSAEGNLEWTVQVHGTFYYDGLMSSCTSASHSVTIYNTAWSVSSQSSYATDYRAVASVTLQKRVLGAVIATRTANPVLACDKYGNLS